MRERLDIINSELTMLEEDRHEIEEDHKKATVDYFNFGKELDHLEGEEKVDVAQ